MLLVNRRIVISIDSVNHTFFDRNITRVYNENVECGSCLLLVPFLRSQINCHEIE